jgi:hypothetical protein
MNTEQLVNEMKKTILELERKLEIARNKIEKQQTYAIEQRREMNFLKKIYITYMEQDKNLCEYIEMLEKKYNHKGDK